MWKRLVDALDRARKRQALAVRAYVLMPNHVHLIQWPRNGWHAQAMESMLTRITARACHPPARRLTAELVARETTLVKAAAY
ncbi:MAG: hypothetical protein HOP29_15010 [Phycisphaerales bacterium]|nr:hypothetical protein [Phycisphaerales bacterium]